MLKRYQHIAAVLFRLADAGVISGAWLLAYWARFTIPLIEVTKGFPTFETYAALTPLVTLIWIITLGGHGLYSGRRMLRRTDEAFLLLRAHAAALLVFIAATSLFSEYRYSRGVLLYFGLVGAAALVITRLSLRNLLRLIRRRGYNLRHALIVGAGPVTDMVAARLQKFPELGLRLHGIVGPDGYSQLGPKLDGIDQLLIALPRKDYGRLDEILEQVKDLHLEVQLLPDVHEYLTIGCRVEDFEGHPLVILNDTPLDGWGLVAKRMTDIVLSAAALLVLSPVLIIVALLVKLTSRGPVLYSQERMGLDGRTFRMFKFRSMRADAESTGGAQWASPGDPRRTGLGSFLRASSLDELPQFWNVLMGDMSLVGPRPERPVFVTQFRSQIPNYLLRHKVKAGITGWAQVNGWRGNTSLEKRIECDLFYIRNWSYALDLRILALTLVKGFVNRNAY